MFKETQDKKYLILVRNPFYPVRLLETDNIIEAKNAINKYVEENKDPNFNTGVIYGDMFIVITFGRELHFIFLYFLDLNAKREYLGEELWKKLYD